jgi:hypothetical protein
MERRWNALYSVVCLMEGEREKSFSLEVQHEVTHHAVASACIRKTLPVVNYSKQSF